MMVQTTTCVSSSSLCVLPSVSALPCLAPSPSPLPKTKSSPRGQFSGRALTNPCRGFTTSLHSKLQRGGNRNVGTKSTHFTGVSQCQTLGEYPLARFWLQKGLVSQGCTVVASQPALPTRGKKETNVKGGTRCGVQEETHG